MDDLDLRLRTRLRVLADAVPVTPPGDRPARVRASTRTASVLPLAAGAVIVLIVVLGASIRRLPASTPLPSVPSEAPVASQVPSAEPTETPPATESPSATAWLRYTVLIEGGCPEASEGGPCIVVAMLTGPGAEAREVLSAHPPMEIGLGEQRVHLEARLPSDVYVNGNRMPDAVLSSCDVTFTPAPGTTVDMRGVIREGSCVLEVDDATPVEAPDARPPSDAVLPFPEGCDDYGLSVRRCGYIVDEAMREAGVEGRPAVIELLGDPECDGKPAPCSVIRTMSFVVRVRVTPHDRASSDHSVFCGVSSGGSLACLDEPVIGVSAPIGTGYGDVPCTGEGPSGCATPVPSAAPDAIAEAVELHVPSLTIPIDHSGAYVVDVGEALLPNGILSEASLVLADDRRTDVLIPDGIALVIEGEDGEPLLNEHDHGWREGTERVRVTLRFEVEMFDPGTSITLTDIVVR
jgi:hypothetical protein